MQNMSMKIQSSLRLTPFACFSVSLSLFNKYVRDAGLNDNWTLLQYIFFNWNMNRANDETINFLGMHCVRSHARSRAQTVLIYKLNWKRQP